MALTSAQIRAARALIRWSAEDLSRHSSVSLRTIRRAELAEGETNMTAANDLSLRRALESAGVEFTNGDRPGVRLARVAAARSAESSGASDQAATVKAVRGKTAKPSKKKR
jgi:hypothetical protein